MFNHRTTSIHDKIAKNDKTRGKNKKNQDLGIGQQT